jgi:peptidoglycan/xylan/chitin deacetylase (PgdA/CDA1 family)
MDELWAIAQCYNLAPFPEGLNPVDQNGAPRLAALFDELQIRATWFVVGRDVMDHQGPAAEFLRARIAAGDRVANHSQSHQLRFRTLSSDSLRQEIRTAHRHIHQATGQEPIGFRAPGYGHTPALIRELIQQGYRYDSSLCPSPFGFVFRWMDRRITASVRSNGWQAPTREFSDCDVPKPTVRNRRAIPTCPDGLSLPEGHKTQYSILADLRYPIAPHWQDGIRPEPSPEGCGLIEYPTAIAPGFRLPYQAGICMRLGPLYTKLQTAAWRHLASRTPLTLLIHGADLTDFTVTGHPFFLKSPFFVMDMELRIHRLRTLLQAALAHRACRLTEDCLQ